MPAHKHILGLLIAIAPFAARTAWSQSAIPQTQYVRILTDTSYVSCAGKPFGSRLARSDYLISQDGRYRAYAEVEALWYKPIKLGQYPEDPADCVNTSKVFLSGPESKGFKLIFLQEPGVGEGGNSLTLVDWSSKGHLLLAQLTLWNYLLEGSYNKVLIYDVEHGRLWDTDTFEAFRSSLNKNNCAVQIEVRGFSPEGNVVIQARPVNEDYYGPSCLAEAGLWLLNLDGVFVRQLPDNYQVHRYGRTEPQVRKH